MTPAETARVLAAIAAFDQRTVGTSDVAAWHSVVSDVPYEDARQAVIRHYSDSTDRIMPAHLRHLAGVIAEERAESEWVVANAHDFQAYDGSSLCRRCGLPPQNRRHRRPA